jgi:TolB-like protein/DNA-binding winged helix-turn-helix (wHTH) protein/thioredoxin-like negative regulator of GroEL
MATLDIGQRQYAFGEFTLDVARGALRRGGNDVKLRRQSFEVLRYLVEHQGRLVTKRELLDSVWGGTVVTDGSLTQCLIDVRRALGDQARQTIRTMPRRGYIFEAPVAKPEASAGAAVPSAQIARNAGGHRWPLAAGGLLLLAAAAAWWLLPFDSPADTGLPARPNSIAVLPFEDMSETQNHSYLSEGISEEILNLLADSPDLHVIARTSSFSFRDQNADIATIADKLGVAYVLQGSVRRSDDRLRIASQLIDAGTSTEVWSEGYDRELGDVLVLQSEIAAAVAGALQVTLSLAPTSPRPGPEIAEAHERFLQGRLFHNRRATGDIQRAEEYFRQALDIDPTYGRAWAGLAGTYFVRVAGEGAADAATAAAWQNAVEQALRYAPHDAEAQMRAAQFYWRRGEDDTAMAHMRQATILGPQNPLILSSWAGIRVFQGRLDEALARQRRAVALDPLGAIGHGNLAGTLAGVGLFEEALAEERKALDLNPSDRPDFERAVAAIFIAERRFDEALEIARHWPAGADRSRALALIYHASGRSEDADAALRRLLADDGAALGAAEVYAYRGGVDEAFRQLEIALEAAPAHDRGKQVRDARLSPFLVTLRDDPRWQRMLAYWH